MKPATATTLVGVFCVLGGLFALANPFAASLSTELLVGWLFLIGGILGVVSALRDPAQRMWMMLSAFVALAIGVFMVANPLSGLVALTALIAVALFVGGVVRLIWAARLKETPMFWLLLVSGAVSVLLGGMILANFPQSALTVIGVFLGIELLLTGVPLIVLGLSQRQE